MRKTIKVFVVICAVFLLSGCRKNYLICEQTSVDTDTLRVRKTIKLGYQRSELVESRMYLDYFFKDFSQEDAESLKNSLKEESAMYDDIEGVEYSISDIDDGIHYELILEVDKISDENADDFDELINYRSFTDAEEKLRKNYSCK